MVRLYLDLETHRPRKEDAFLNEKIVTIGVLRDESPFAEASLTFEPSVQIFSEKGDGSEKQMIVRLMGFMDEIYKTHTFSVLTGFNLARFDIPILISRAVQLGIHSVDKVSKFWHDRFTIDYFQQLLMANNMMFKGTTLPTVVKVSKEMGLNPPPLYGGSGEIAALYESGKLDEIIAHMIADLKIVRWLDLFGAKRLLKAALDKGTALFKAS